MFETWCFGRSVICSFEFDSSFIIRASSFKASVQVHRTVHYEAAFEAFLRGKGIPYVAVDEAKKALFADAKLKSFDFVVYSKTGPNLLIDVKGRQVQWRE